MPKSVPERENDLANELLVVAEAASGVQKLALAQAAREAAGGRLRNPAGAARNAAIVSGISIEKKLLLESRPTQITEHREAADILRSLSEKVPGLFIQGSASDVVLELPEKTTPAEPEGD